MAAAWLAVVGEGDRYALLGTRSRTYERGRLLDLDRKMAEWSMDLLPTPTVSRDLVVWNVWGPADGSQVYDVMYRAARLP